MTIDKKFFRREIRSGYEVSEKMKKVWAVQLDLLDYFDQLCRKHNLRYYVDYGTLLGAVRHQGFIPWDDDIDVVMFRDEYEKLKMIAQDEIEFPYFFQNSYTDRMIWAFSKLRDGRTTAIEFPDFPLEFHQGIFIDIFPLDDVPDGANMKPIVGEMQRELWLSLVNPDGLKEAVECGNRLVLDADIIMGLLQMGIRERMKMFEDFNAARCGMSSQVSFITDEFMGVPSVLREWYSDTVYLPFEDRMVPAPAEYDKVLKCRYGDYMTPAQIPNQHDGIFYDPDVPYTHYIGDAYIHNSFFQKDSEVVDIICMALKVKRESLYDIKVSKKGMTNQSFSFMCEGKKYIMRIPGIGTGRLINREQETKVYQVIRDKNICDNIIYINPENGNKITEFLSNARVCNPLDEEDVRKCMERLRAFHELNLTVDHTFDIFGQIEFYEELWGGASSAYGDYATTKAGVMSLRSFIDGHKAEYVLAHIDAVPDNFLFVEKEDREDIFLIDWEYAGMQDPHVDIAMFAIYSLYDRKQVDSLISAYFPEGCSEVVRIKIYCYISACGLLWSNWCEYKKSLGVEFGEYSARQYFYAKEYFKIAKSEMINAGVDKNA